MSGLVPSDTPAHADDAPKPSVRNAAVRASRPGAIRRLTARARLAGRLASSAWPRSTSMLSPPTIVKLGAEYRVSVNGNRCTMHAICLPTWPDNGVSWRVDAHSYAIRRRYVRRIAAMAQLAVALGATAVALQSSGSDGNGTGPITPRAGTAHAYPA